MNENLTAAYLTGFHKRDEEVERLRKALNKIHDRCGEAMSGERGVAITEIRYITTHALSVESKEK